MTDLAEEADQEEEAAVDQEEAADQEEDVDQEEADREDVDREEADREEADQVEVVVTPEHAIVVIGDGDRRQITTKTAIGGDLEVEEGEEWQRHGPGP